MRLLCVCAFVCECGLLCVCEREREKPEETENEINESLMLTGHVYHTLISITDGQSKQLDVDLNFMNRSCSALYIEQFHYYYSWCNDVLNNLFHSN